MILYITLAIFALLTLICLFSSKISSHINMPCLLLFLAIGMLAGSEGIGGIAHENATLSNYIGSIAMAFILFSGGFDTHWKSVKSVFLTGGILSSLGVLLTAIFTGLFAWTICHIFLPEKEISFSWCLLLGAIISSTDAAAVFSILRSRSVSLKGKLKELLEFESGSNDPMAAFLTIFMTAVVLQETQSGQIAPLSSYWIIFPTFLLKMSIGLAVGFIVGRICVWIFNKIDFDYNGLYYVLAIVAVMFSFSLPELIEGNGFMAVYVAGMVMGNNRFVFHNGIGKFYDGIAWMMQVVLFTMLGLLATPSIIWEMKWFGLSIALFLMLVARPLATFIGMWRSKFSINDRVLISWVGLRGGAPIMLATFPLMENLANSQLMFHIVFFIVITSVLLQGMSIMPVARLLKLDAPTQKTPRIPLSIEETGDYHTKSQEFVVEAHFTGKPLSGLAIPEGALILLIRRGAELIVPKGDTVLQEGDVLTIMGSNDAINDCRTKFLEC